MYHRTADVVSDPWALCVKPSHFAQHLEVLSKYTSPISLRHFERAHREGAIPRRAVVITFDDGYSDNLYNAKPLLERYNIPATVFVTTGQIGKSREFWWDELERLFLQPGSLPARLRLQINGKDFQWDLGKEIVYSEADVQNDRKRRAWEGKPGSRLSLYYSIWQKLITLSEGVRQIVLDEIRNWVGKGDEGRPTYRALLPEEVYALGQGELVEVGAHSVTHPLFSTIPVRQQRDEIFQSKTYLEEILGRSVTSFAYPHGDYTEKTIELIRETGFTSACTTEADNIWYKTDRFQWPRIQVQDWDGDTFARRLFMWSLT